MLYITIISFFSYWLDQLFKYLVYKNITNVTIIPNFLSLLYKENTGAAFSILENNRIIIIMISIVLILFLFNELFKSYKINKRVSKLEIVSYGILFGGILGNLFDRVYRGYVIDYVSVKILNYYFPIFNFADVLIIVGVILLLIHMIREERKIRPIQKKYE